MLLWPISKPTEVKEKSIVVAPKTFYGNNRLHAQLTTLNQINLMPITY